MSMVVLGGVLLFCAASTRSFQIYATKELDCQSSSIQCISNTTFTTCASLGPFSVLLNTRMTCPDGYICNEATSSPCILESQINDTTSSTTTIEAVTKPSGLPECTAAGLYAAPECNQYYECVKKKGFFAKGFTAELRNCTDGDYFDTALQSCVLASQSDCSEDL
ncbi:hypothetical protein JTB14_026387 [Gonioctena quinquepunctata]|nr:hypothetical protein JTB14_026387 [Gonioctena quinquepunctata]